MLVVVRAFFLRVAILGAILRRVVRDEVLRRRALLVRLTRQRMPPLVSCDFFDALRSSVVERLFVFFSRSRFETLLRGGGAPARSEGPRARVDEGRRRPRFGAAAAWCHSVLSGAFPQLPVCLPPERVLIDKILVPQDAARKLDALLEDVHRGRNLVRVVGVRLTPKLLAPVVHERARGEEQVGRFRKVVKHVGEQNRDPRHRIPADVLQRNRGYGEHAKPRAPAKRLLTLERRQIALSAREHAEHVRLARGFVERVDEGHREDDAVEVHGDRGEQGVDRDSARHLTLRARRFRVEVTLGALHRVRRRHHGLDRARQEERRVDGVVFNLRAQASGNLGDAVHHQQRGPAAGVLAVVQNPLVHGVQTRALQPRAQLVLELV
mmetsp:Transcript_12446/g.52134  ORF Transcript_12446/g.52134 Transcript_12446/m.52134 type:complete len:380 (-) Transcript_12446:2682-3821(-)